MESVLNQTSDDVEHIIIDGASTDESVDLIKSKAEKLAYWVSEPDNGIYNAMNKGIQKAKGKYVHFLNSGDWLVDNQVVEKMLHELKNECDIMVGNVISIRPDGKMRTNKNRKEVSLLTFYGGTIQHTSAYIRKDLFNKYGLYDESLKIVSDWKWYLMVAGLNPAKVSFTDTFVSYFDNSGISSTNLNLDKFERRKVLEELVPAPVLADYDTYYFNITQIERLKKHKFIYFFYWFIERCLFKLEKWKLRYLGWKK